MGRKAYGGISNKPVRGPSAAAPEADGMMSRGVAWEANARKGWDRVEGGIGKPLKGARISVPVTGKALTALDRLTPSRASGTAERCVGTASAALPVGKAP